jgi:ubiquinone/menaquinone biosynthesis C-methylase UbiE
VVGDPGGQGRGAAVAPGLRAAYDAAADGWPDGPQRVYRPLAEALVAAAPVPVPGLRVLDLGAGTGAAGRAALAAGARQVVAADLSLGMLRSCTGPVCPVAADAARLPFLDGSFGLVVAAFCVNHLASLAGALAEARRVGQAIAASAFAPGWTHPAKAAVDAVLSRFGYQPPPWYVTFKQDSDARASDPAALAASAAAAGFTDVRLATIRVATGVTTPAQLAAWRLGMAHVAPFVRALGPAQRARLEHAAVRTLTGCEPLEVSMLALTGRAPAGR